MVNVIVELTKYLMIILIAVYTYECFAAFKNRSEQKRRRLWFRQKLLLYTLHFFANLVLYLKTENTDLFIFYGAQVILLVTFMALYRVIYPKVSAVLVNNMSILLCIGFFMLTRLSYTKAVRQFKIVIISMILSMLVPFLIVRLKFLKELTWLYAGVGILLLGIVAVLGGITNGAKLSFTILGITVQPSEFVKILFVFFTASILAKSTDFLEVVKATAVAAVHVMILVFSKDLGGALIFFIAYLMVLYAATKKSLYLFGGLAAGSVAAVIAYKLFAHVRTRVVAWRDPFSVIDKEGYQVTQSLFAIGTGGWFGLGLFQGAPNKIPVVGEDFIFAAISEELGGLFALCVILICVSCFVLFMNIAMCLEDNFYRYTATGLATIYGFQVFLTIGGVTKFIPSTGVTLPLVSSGGSSILSTLIMFGIIQGLYIMKQNEGERLEKQENGK